jgi:hypothetical protein
VKNRRASASKIVNLPDCFQVNDRKRKITAHTPTREEAGLPAEGFVFCCFNNNWKITPTIFDVWMRARKKKVRRKVTPISRAHFKAGLTVRSAKSRVDTV